MWLYTAAGFCTGIVVGALVVIAWLAPRIAKDIIALLLDEGTLGVCAICEANENEDEAVHNVVMHIPDEVVIGWKGNLQ